LDSGCLAGDSELILLRKAVGTRLPQYIHRKAREGRKAQKINHGECPRAQGKWRLKAVQKVENV